MKNTITTILFILLVTSSAFSGGRYAGSQLELGIGSRSIALGGAAAAMTGSGETFQYNVATLAFVERSHINLMYAPTFGSLTDPMANYNYAGFTYPLAHDATIAFSWARYAVDEIPIFPDPKGSSFAERNEDINLRPDGVALGYFNYTSDVMYFSFAKNSSKEIPLGWMYMDIPVDLSFGMNFKVIRQKLYYNHANGLGIDMGFLMKLPFDKLFDMRKLGEFNLGVSLNDMTQTSITWDTDNKTQETIRRTYMFGMSYTQKLWFKNSDIRLFYTFREKYYVKKLYGIELNLKALSVRAGLNDSGFSTGAGLHFWRMAVDYAFAQTDFENIQRISCNFYFNSK